MIIAYWQLPSVDSQNGIVTGCKLFFKKKDSAVSATMVPINSGATLTKDDTGLDKYAEYEFQVLAFTYVSNAPKNYTKVKITLLDDKNCDMCTGDVTKSLHL